VAGDAAAQAAAAEAARGPLAASGHPNAAVWLADVLTEHGRVDEAIEHLRVAIVAGDRFAAARLADLLI
jgi:thioredoxin-like negative regulator of GroEL